MLRSKIIGQDHFNRGGTPTPRPINSDLGIFSIGSFGEIPIFQDSPIPPKKLWIRAKLTFKSCPEIQILQESTSLMWNAVDRCASVKVTPQHLLYAGKEHQVAKDWTLCQEQPVLEHIFAVAPTISAINSHPDKIHLWPCGGAMSSDLFQIEQGFAEAPLEGSDVYVNALSTWQKHLSRGNDNVVFEPPGYTKLSLGVAITHGKFSTNIGQQGLEFRFSSLRFEPSTTMEFIDILCERND